MCDALYVGPLTMEFGHEVQANGLIRARASGHRRVIVCSFPERFALYRDIAHEFRPHSIKCVCNCDRPAAGEDVDDAIERESRAAPPQADIWAPRWAEYDRGDIGERATYTPHGRRAFEWAGVILFHARARMELGADHNWPAEKWDSLACRLRERHRLISVGSLAAAHHVRGTDDWRGVPLGQLCDAFASCDLAVGPSSGPIHLASHCMCPHVTWNGDTSRFDQMVERYERRWNPFDTPVVMLKRPTWNPSVADVLEAIMAALSRSS